MGNNGYHKRLKPEKEQEIIEYWRTNSQNNNNDVAKATGVTSSQVGLCLDRYFKKIQYGFRT